MRKLFIALLLVLLCLFGGCQSTPVTPPDEIIQPEEEPQPDEVLELEEEPKPAEFLQKDYKIVLYTPKIFNWMEAFNAAKSALQRHPDKITHLILPEMYYRGEEEKMIEIGLEAIQDPAVKAFIISTSHPQDAFASLFAQIKEQRPDILLIAYEDVLFDPCPQVREAADIMIAIDEVSMSEKMVGQAQKLGAKTFVYYYTKNWLESDLNKRKYDAASLACQDLGLEFIARDMGLIHNANGPVPIDIYSQVDEYGKDTNFFYPFQVYPEPMIKVILELEAILAQLADPDMASYFDEEMATGTPWPKLDESNPDDIELWIQAIKNKITEKGGNGRFSAWRVPTDMLALTAATEYAIRYCEGLTKGRADIEVMRECFAKGMEIYNAAGTGFELNAHPEYSNYFLFTEDYIIF